MGDTLEIFGKEYTNVAGFKAKDSSGNTLTYTRGGGGGVDIPIFTLTWDSNFETILSVTCNKAYAQCESICQSSETPTAAAIALTDEGDALFYDSLSFADAIGGTDTRGDVLVYICSERGTPLYDILFFEDGTITAVQPSNSVQTLNVTTNGTYTPKYGGYVWNEVVVNVSSGSPTLQSKTATYTPTETQQTATITADSGYDGLSSVGITVGAVSSTYVGSGIARKTFTKADALAGLDDEGGYIFVNAGYYADDASISVGTANSTNKPTISINSATGLITSSIDIEGGWVGTYNAGTRTTTQQLTTQAAKTVTPTESSQTAVAAGVYTTGAVTVGAISSTYVGTGISRKDGDDLTASGATVTVPAGYYASQATKSVASGSAGTPTAAKGTVSNHSITVTPSVTNTTGYITGGTKSGTGVTVSASELVSGSQTITANGTVNVTNLASVNVAIAYSTITVSSSNPSGGNNGDIWIKT